ncbi:MAG: DUF4126 family protein [Candidatus Korobacteraceae bacterium]|jgi:uncharacterized membrane protein
MSIGFVLLLTFGIGVVSGLRTFTGPAAVVWAAHLGWINLSGTPLAFMGSTWALVLFTILALLEYVGDQLPSTPARTSPMQLGARLVLGVLAGISLAAAGGASLLLGAICAVVGVLVGTYGGYNARVALVRSLKVPDIAVGVPEDLIAIALGLFVVSRL